MTLLLLLLAAFLAGFVDAVAGGGGLIQLPALFVLMPEGTPPVLIMGTNKLAAMVGTSVAVTRYVRRVSLPWRSLLPGTAAAFVASFLGARTVPLLSPQYFKPIVLVLLVLVTIYTFVRRDFGSLHAPRLSPAAERGYGVLFGMIIGFYDGFVGPGTGSFLIFLFISVYGFSFLSASGAAKIVNLATNLSALIFFVVLGAVDYGVALPMAAANLTGSFLGASLALKRGAGFVRILFLAVATVLLLRFAYEALL